MRRHLLTLGASLLGAAASLAQTPPGLPPARTMPLPQQVPPARQLPPDMLPGGLVPGGKPASGPPSQPLTPPKSDAPPEPVGVQRFDGGSMRLRHEGSSWQLWAGNQLLKDFGPSKTDAEEALQVFRDLRVNSRGSIGGVFEYWLAEGTAPSAITRYRRVIPFDAQALRVEKAKDQWVLRDAHRILYSFGHSETDARQALAVCKRYGFNEVGYVGHPTPTLKYLMRDPHPSLFGKGFSSQITQASAKAPAPVADPLAGRSGLPLVLPKVGTVGAVVPFDARRLDLRRESGEWVMYVGKTPLGRFGTAERAARTAVQALQQFHVSELCRVGESEFSFFLSNGRAPQGASIVGLSAQPLHADQLAVRKVGDEWAVCEGARTLWTFGENAEDARHALAAIRHYGFDYVVPVGGGRLGNVHLFVKSH